jgi:ribosomal protein RSM22 (predicted rRNA methylase)
MPVTFAAVDRVLAERARRRPDMAPANLLDAASGPGTAAWAAVGRWPGLETFTFLDDARAFLDLAVDLSRHGPAPLAAARALQGQIQAVHSSCREGPSADLLKAACAPATCRRSGFRHRSRALSD